MGALDDINLLLQKKDDNGFKPVAPWQEGFEEGEDVNGNPTTTEPMARAARKRAGLPVDDNPHDHTGTPAVEKAGTAAGTEEKPQYSIAELIKLSHPYNEERTKEEEERQKKKQKRDAVFAAIGDGLNAFHQAYAYSRGIKPLTENKSQSKAVRDKYDALDKEREAHKAEYLNAYIRGLQMDEAAKRSKAQDEYNAAALEVRKGELQARNDKLALDTFTSTWKKDIAEGTLDVKKRQQEIDELYKLGRISEMARNAASRELQAQAAMLRAQNGGNVGGYEVTETKTDSRGRTTTTTKKRVPTGNGKKTNPMGGNNNNGKKQNPMN